MRTNIHRQAFVTASFGLLLIVSGCGAGGNYSVTAGGNSQSSGSNLRTDPQRIVGYFPVGVEGAISDPLATALARIPAYVTVVNLAFMRPNAVYNGNLDISQTGINYAPGGDVLKAAISALRRTNHGTKVLISVGGWDYGNWSSFDEFALARLVRDFNLDGVDIDYERQGPGCSWSSGGHTCATDKEFTSIIQRVRAVIPKPKLVTVTGFNVGAYGNGPFGDETPQDAFTGFNINPLLNAGSLVDWVNIMSYDGGTNYDPKIAFQAYRLIYKGPLVLGVEVPPEGGPGHNLTLSEVSDWTKYQLDNGGAGIMLWHLYKQPDGALSPSNPNSSMVLQTACPILGLSECDEPLP